MFGFTIVKESVLKGLYSEIKTCYAKQELIEREKMKEKLRVRPSAYDYNFPGLDLTTRERWELTAYLVTTHITKKVMRPTHKRILKAWETFILDTLAYTTYCDKYYGEYIHIGVEDTHLETDAEAIVSAHKKYFRTTRDESDKLRYVQNDVDSGIHSTLQHISFCDAFSSLSDTTSQTTSSASSSDSNTSHNTGPSSTTSYGTSSYDSGSSSSSSYSSSSSSDGGSSSGGE